MWINYLNSPKSIARSCIWRRRRKSTRSWRWIIWTNSSIRRTFCRRHAKVKTSRRKCCWRGKRFVEFKSTHLIVNADTSVKPSTITPVPSKAPAAQSSFRPPMIPKPNDSVSNASVKPLGKPPSKVPPPVPAISNATPSIGKNGPPLPGRRPSEIAALKSPTSSGPPPVPSIPKPTKSPTSSNENISGSVFVSEKIVMPKRGSVSAKLAPPVPGRPRSISTGSSEKINTSAGKLPPAVPNRPLQGNSRTNEKINDNDGSQKVSSPGQLRKQPPVPGGSVTKPATLGRSPSIPLSSGPLSDDMDDGRYKFRPDSELPPPHAFTPSIKVYYSGAVTGSKYNIGMYLLFIVTYFRFTIGY